MNKKKYIKIVVGLFFLFLSIYIIGGLTSFNGHRVKDRVENPQFKSSGEDYIIPENCQEVSVTYSPDKNYKISYVSCSFTDKLRKELNNQWGNYADGQPPMFYGVTTLLDKNNLIITEWGGHLSYNGPEPVVDYKVSEKVVEYEFIFIDNENILTKESVERKGFLSLDIFSFNVKSRENTLLHTFYEKADLFGILDITDEGASFTINPRSDGGFLPERIRILKDSKVVESVSDYEAKDDEFWYTKGGWGYAYDIPKKYGYSTHSMTYRKLNIEELTLEYENRNLLYKNNNRGFQIYRVPNVDLDNYKFLELLDDKTCFTSFNTDYDIKGFVYESETCAYNLGLTGSAHLCVLEGYIEKYPYLLIYANHVDVPESEDIIRSFKKSSKPGHVDI